MDARSRNIDPLIFIVTGESSGDQLGARLMSALKQETGGHVRFEGVGGDAMAREGLVTLFPVSDIALMGIIEVLAHIPRVLKRLRETVAAIRAHRPAVVVTIDSPDFSFRVARRLRGSGIRVVHYVAPTVWAWRAGRARKIAGFLSRLLAVLPFEPPYFTPHGLRCDFVGHPLVELQRPGDGPAFRTRYAIPMDATLLLVMPGSRRSDVRNMGTTFRDTVALLARQVPRLHVVVPAVTALTDLLHTSIREWAVTVTIVPEIEKWDVFAASDLALVKSGTGVLEVTMAGVPLVVGYRASPLGAWIVQRMMTTPWVTLPNILLRRMLNPELIQRECRPDRLAAEVLRIFRDSGARQAQIAAARQVAQMLGADGVPPSLRAARAVIDEVRLAEEASPAP